MPEENIDEREYVSPDEEAEAASPDVGEGTPETAPERKVRVSWLDQIRYFKGE